MEIQQRQRAVGIIVEQGKIVVIKRTFPEVVHYAYPGGKVEIGEDIRIAVKRELFEELGVIVEVGKLVATVKYHNHMQYYHLAKIVGGQFGNGKGEEFEGERANTFAPMWISLAELAHIPIRPAILTDYLIQSAQNDWPQFHFDEDAAAINVA